MRCLQSVVRWRHFVSVRVAVIVGWAAVFGRTGEGEGEAEAEAEAEKTMVA